MLASLFAFAIGILLFALSAEADTPFLEVTAVVIAVWFVFAGAVTGWRAARNL